MLHHLLRLLPGNLKPTLSGFIKFINAQPADRTIDHFGGWSHCAVGDYVKSLRWCPVGAGEIATRLFVEELKLMRVTPFELLHWYKYDDQSFVAWLCNASARECNGDTTYGALQAHLKEVPHLSEIGK